MQIPEKTKAGARKIVTRWNTIFCDAPTTCTHDHTSAAVSGFTFEGMIADLKLIDDLRRIEQDDFSPPAAPAAATAEAPSYEDAPTGEDLGRHLVRLWRMNWQSHAEWLGLPQARTTDYQGEESADGPPELAPVARV
jgi:hypothetical protein